MMTLEDPIERIVDGTSQTQVDPTNGLGFADGLRHLLRHDPDVMLVGEVRDPETAGLAIEAAHTGHLVLSSLHAVDAPGALTRLTELGVPAAMLADTVRSWSRSACSPSPARTATARGRRGPDRVRRLRRDRAPAGAAPSPRSSSSTSGSGSSCATAADRRPTTRPQPGRVPRLREVALERAGAGLARPGDALRATPTPAPVRAVAAVGTLGPVDTHGDARSAAVRWPWLIRPDTRRR
jgi:general secretion pathway protein E